jgi:surfactin synthase thioesterase subunit
MAQTLVSLTGSDEAPVSLVCIPWGGAGAASFRSWIPFFPPNVRLLAVRFPGRESRLRECPTEDMAEAVRMISEEVPSSGRIALFGHCVGALVAFEVARRITQMGPELVHLFVASQVSPRLQRDVPPISDLRSELRRLGATPAAVLENDELLALLAPAIQADRTMSRLYAYRDRGRLDVPITVFTGETAGYDRSELDAWGAETSATLRVVQVGGGHMLLGDSWLQVAKSVAEQLSELS